VTRSLCPPESSILPDLAFREALTAVALPGRASLDFERVRVEVWAIGATCRCLDNENSLEIVEAVEDLRGAICSMPCGCDWISDGRGWRGE